MRRDKHFRPLDYIALVVYLVTCLSPGLALKKLTTYTAFEI